MTSISDLKKRIDRQLLLHGNRPAFDTASGGFTTAATTINLSTVDYVEPGALLDCEFELMYVTAHLDPNVTVIRGFQGTTARAGAATDIIAINPDVPGIAIYDGIVAELQSWDERLFTVELETVSFGASDTTVEVTPFSDPYRVLYARPDPPSSTSSHKWLNAELRRSEATDEFASGYSLSIPAPFGRSTTVYVAYAVPFDLTGITTTTDLVGDVGLTEGMCEILVWGALDRLTAGKQLGRLDLWAASRLQGEQVVPALAPAQTASEYMRRRNLAYNREAAKLLAKWPYRFNG